MDLQTDMNGVAGLIHLVMDTCPRTKGRYPSRFDLPEMLSTNLVSQCGRLKTAEINQQGSITKVAFTH